MPATFKDILKNMNFTHVCCSAVYKYQWRGQSSDNVIHFNNPTAVAVASVGLLKGTLLLSFLETGGLAAVLGVLQESTCREVAALGYTLTAIAWLLADSEPMITPDQRTQIADEFFKSGGRVDWPTHEVQYPLDGGGQRRETKGGRRGRGRQKASLCPTEGDV